MVEKHLELLKKVIGSDAKIDSELVGGMMNEAYIVSSRLGRFVYYI